MIQTVETKDAARTFATHRELVDEFTRLRASGAVESYSINANAAKQLVMGVRINGAWAYLAGNA